MPRRPFPRALARPLAAVLLACFAHAVSARQPSPGVPPTATPQASPTPFKVGLLVADAKNTSLDGVRREDVRVTLGGVEQAVSLFARDESPVSFGLVVDNSGSLRELMDTVVAAAQSFVRNLRPGDEAFAVRFVGSDQINLLHDFTADRAALERALGEMFVEGGETAVFDALHLSAEHLVTKSTTKGAGGGPRRRALVLISDGDDRASYHRAEQVMRLLREHDDVQVFCIGLPGMVDRTSLVRESRKERADKFLKQLAGETGGRAFFPEKVGELKEAVTEVILGLRARYVVGFVPAGKDAQPASGRLEIKVSGAPGQADRQAFYRPWVFKKGEPERKK